MKSIVSRSVEEGECEQGGGWGVEQGRNSVTFFDPLWRSSSFPPSLCPPPPPLTCMFCPAKHLSAGMKLERKRFRDFACTQCLLWSHLPVLILASAYRSILIWSHHICQHQYLKLNYRLGVAQNGGNDDYNQTRGSAVRRCLKPNTHSFFPLFRGSKWKELMTFSRENKSVCSTNSFFRSLSPAESEENPEDGEALFRQLRKLTRSNSQLNNYCGLKERRKLQIATEIVSVGSGLELLKQKLSVLISR